MKGDMKGISATFTIVIMVLLVVFIGASAWGYINNMFLTVGGCIKIVDYKGDSLVLRNCGQRDILWFNVTLAGIPVELAEIDTSIGIGETKWYHLLDFPKGGMQKIRIVSNVGTATAGYEIPRAWIMKAETHWQAGGPGEDDLLIISGKVFLNDHTAKLYTDKILEYQLDGLPAVNITTNSTGQFNITKPWNFTSLLPGKHWVIENYSASQIVGNSMLEPPGSVDFDGTVVETQQPYALIDDSGLLLGWKDITPLEVTADSVKLRFDYTVDLQTSITTGPGDSVWYGSNFNKFDLIDFSCDSSVYTCNSGNSSFFVQSNLDGQDFVNTSLPIEPGKGPYIDVEVNVSHFNGYYAGFEVPEFAASQNKAPVKIIATLHLGPARTIGDLNNLKTIMSIPFEDIRVVEISENETWTGRIYLNELENELTKKYNITEAEQNYTIKYSVAAPGQGQDHYVETYEWFRINDTFVDVAQPFGNTTWYVYAYSNAVFKGKKTFFWDTGSIANSIYTFSYNATFPRKAAPTTWGITKEFIYLIDNAGNVTDKWVASAGMRYMGSDPGWITELKIPSQGDEYFAYTLGQLDWGNNTRIKNYLVNVGTQPISNTIIHVARGERNTCTMGNMQPGESITCTLDENPAAGEIVSNMLYLEASGYDLTFDYSINDQYMDECYLNVTLTGECATGTKSCSGNHCTYRRPNSNEFMNETDIVNSMGDGFLKAEIGIVDLLPGTPAGSRIIAWNWYLNPNPLWDNQAEHTIVFETMQPGVYYPAHYTYIFTT
jgi:hypothetical protein